MKPRDIFQKSSIIFLQIVVVLFGVATLAFLLWEPHLEGRNENAMLSQIYFNDPFLIYAYTGSIAFFVALYSIFRILGYAAQKEIFTSRTINALKRIKICSVIVVCFAIGFELYLVTAQRQIEEDIAGGVMMGLVVIVGSVVAAAMANMFQKSVQSAMDTKTKKV